MPKTTPENHESFKDHNPWGHAKAKASQSDEAITSTDNSSSNLNDKSSASATSASHNEGVAHASDTGDDIKVLDFRQTRFVTSAPDIRHLPDDLGAEIAFAGRSNSGKSSALNAICDQSHLAKTSRTPGRTRLINLFEVKHGCFLVDLPGYGYAAVSDSMKRQWQKSMSEYLQKRQALRGIVVTMDIRHPLKDHDRLILDWSIAANLPALILLTKADKLGTNARRESIKEVKLQLSEFGGDFTVVSFSAWKKMGLDEVRKILSNWFTMLHGYDPEN